MIRTIFLRAKRNQNLATIVINRGPTGPSGPGGGGDMLSATYDPQGIEGDAFDMANMTEGADAKVMTAAERASIAALGTASTREADQDLRTTDAVEFDTVTADTVNLHTAAFDTTNGGPTSLGEMAWDSTDGTLDIQADGGVKIAVGEDGLIRVRNNSGATIPKGVPLVYAGTTGASGKLEVGPWIGANVTNVRTFLGFAAGEIAHNTDGYAVWFGKIKEIDTDGGAESWNDGDILYAIPGASATLSNVAPTSGDYVTAAVVINAGSGTSGILFSRPTFDTVAAASVINFEDLGDASTADIPTINTPLSTALGLKADTASLGTAAFVNSDQNLRTDDDVRFSTIRTSGATIYGLDDGSGNTAYAQFSHSATGDLTISTEQTGTGTAGRVQVGNPSFAGAFSVSVNNNQSSPTGQFAAFIYNTGSTNRASGLQVRAGVPTYASYALYVVDRNFSPILIADGYKNVGIGTTTPARKLHVTDAMRLDPTTTPASPSAGDIYFDSSTNKLRCYDGSAWNDLF